MPQTTTSASDSIARVVLADHLKLLTIVAAFVICFFLLTKCAERVSTEAIKANAATELANTVTKKAQ